MPPFGSACEADLLPGEVRILCQAQEITSSRRVVLDPKSEASRRTVALPSIVVEAPDRHNRDVPGARRRRPLLRA